MNYTVRDLVFSAEEFSELKIILSEHRRICRDQVTRYVQGEYQTTECSVTHHRYKIIESIINKIDNIEWLNHTVK